MSKRLEYLLTVRIIGNANDIGISSVRVAELEDEIGVDGQKIGLALKNIVNDHIGIKLLGKHRVPYLSNILTTEWTLQVLIPFRLKFLEERISKLTEVVNDMRYK